MSKRNAVALAEAWHEYWDVISPDAPDWQTALSKWVHSNLVAYSETAYQTGLSQHADWTNCIDLSCQTEGVVVTVGDHTFQRARWFSSDGLRLEPPTEFNPLELLVRRTDANAATIRDWHKHANTLIVIVAARTGDRVRKLFLQALLEERLKASGLSERDGFERRRLLTTDQLRIIKLPQFSLSQIETQRGPVLLEAVEISLGSKFAPERSNYNFDKEDDLLVDEIEELAIKERLSGAEATRRLEHKILTRPGSKASSGFDRVYRQYLRKYGKQPKAKQARRVKPRA